MQDTSLSDAEISEMLVDSLRELGVTNDSPEIEDSDSKILALEVQIQELTKERDEFRDNYLQFKGIFQKQTRMFFDYQNLSPTVKASLDEIYRGNTFEEFLTCGVQNENIYALWDRICDYLRSPGEATSEDLIILRKMLTYFLNLFNHVHTLPVLRVMDTAPGEPFLPASHQDVTDIQGTTMTGTIRDVLFQGLCNSITGNVIRRSLVWIE